MQHVGTTGVAYSSQTSLSAAKPVGTAEGDVILVAMFIRYNFATNIITPPAGFTLLFSQLHTSTLGVHIWQKVAGPSEPANYVFGASLSTHCSLQCSSFTGDFSGFGDIVQVYEPIGNGTPSYTCATVSPENDDSLVYTYTYAREGTEADDHELASSIAVPGTTDYRSIIGYHNPGVGPNEELYGARRVNTDSRTVSIVLEGVLGGEPVSPKSDIGKWRRKLDLDELTLTTQGISLCLSDNRYLYAAMASSGPVPPLAGVYRSSDYGETWQQVSGQAVSRGPEQPICVRVDPDDPMRVFVADGVRGATNGFWRSLDGGDTWEVPAGFTSTAPVTDLYFISPNPDDFDDILITFHSNWPGYTNQQGMMRSLDGGDTWTIIPPPPLMNSLGGCGGGFLYHPDSATGNDSTWFFHTQGDGIWRTTDEGDNWTLVSSEVMAHGGHQQWYDADGNLYVTADEGILRSTDNGATFTDVGPDAEPYIGVFGDNADVFTCNSTHGVVVKADLAVPGTWTRQGNKYFPITVGAITGGGAFAFAYDEQYGRIHGSFQSNHIWAFQRPGFVFYPKETIRHEATLGENPSLVNTEIVASSDAVMTPLEMEATAELEISATADMAMTALEVEAAGAIGLAGTADMAMTPLDMEAEAQLVLSATVDMAMTALEVEALGSVGIVGTLDAVMTPLEMEASYLGELNMFVDLAMTPMETEARGYSINMVELIRSTRGQVITVGPKRP